MRHHVAESSPFSYTGLSQLWATHFSYFISPMWCVCVCVCLCVCVCVCVCSNLNWTRPIMVKALIAHLPHTFHSFWSKLWKI